MPLERGERLGAYEIVQQLGAGGMGEVYRAFDAKLNRHVAVKVLNLSSVANSVTVRRFEQEARAASALNHPGIVTVHDAGESDGRFYIVMELVDGVTLRHLLRRGPRSFKKALPIAGQLADALAKAHEAGVVHRDLKPENVMVTHDDHVKIVDFGLAKLSDRSAVLGPDQESPTESAPGTLLGTVGYMAPEQVRGEPADFRADQFAFGAILYELVTGNRAFHRSTGVETLSMILTEDPPPIAAAAAVPPPVIWLIERCLAKDAKDRYGATRDLAHDVRTLGDHAAEFTTVRSPSRARRWMIVAAASLAVTAAALAYGFQTRWAQPLRRTPAFTQLTFARGHVPNARFGPDGKSVFYSAGWRGAPVQVFETRLTGPESRPLGPPSSSLASVSPTGELAVLLGCRLDFANCVGTLARMPQAGGTPREILEDVLSADWSRDGQTLAAIQAAVGEYQIHFPTGNPIYTSTNKLGHLRFSPGGDRLAFIEYALVSDETGVVKAIDLHGTTTTVSRSFHQIRDLSWSPDGREILVSASEQARDARIHAISLAGSHRLLMHVPGPVFVHDVAPDGRALVTHGSARARILWSSGNEQREVSWLDWSTVADISADGTTVLFYEWGQAVKGEPTVFLRSSNGADAVGLGDGKALALSPDKRWALALQESPKPHLVLLPTGAGTSRQLSAGELTDLYWARWFPDGRRLLVVGEDDKGAPGSYVQEIESGQISPIAEKGLLAVLVAPDGTRVLVNDPLEGFLIWPVGNGEPQRLSALDPKHWPIQWSADGKFLYTRRTEGTSVRIHRFNLATGRSDLVKELAPHEGDGVVGVSDGRGELAITPDGTTAVFTYWTFVRDLFLVEPLWP